MDEPGEINLGAVSRGNVVIYWRGLPQPVAYHIETFTGTGGATWGVNTAANPPDKIHYWTTSSVGLYYEKHSSDLVWIDIYY
jgi:hypothetical protein